MAETLPPASEAAILAILGDALSAEQIDPAGWEAGLTPALSLDEDLGLDSFQLMKVARHLEKAYAFRFSIADWALEEEEHDGVAYTIGSLIAFIQRHMDA